MLVLALASCGVFGCQGGNKTKSKQQDGKGQKTATVPVAPTAAVVSDLAQDAAYDGPVGIPADSYGRLVAVPSTATEPAPLVPARPLAPDRANHRDTHGLTLTAEWLWDKVAPPAAVAETNVAGIKQLKAATKLQWQIELLDVGRLRVVFDAPSFPVAQFTELRARHDLFGHILVWPEADHYRVVPVGALRALLDERRMDVSPVVAATVRNEVSGAPKFGFPTKVTTVVTPWAELVLTQARTSNAGVGGALLCRLLVELAGVDPNTTLCEDGKIPVHAKWKWKGGASLSFDVSLLLIRTDFQSSAFSVPPQSAKFTDSGLPPTTSGVFLTREQMSLFRTKAMTFSLPRTDPQDKGAPGEGLIAVNATDALRYLLLDGVPVAWVEPQKQQYMIGTLAGKYSAQWRSFLGLSIEGAQDILLPARYVLQSKPSH